MEATSADTAADGDDADADADDDNDDDADDCIVENNVSRYRLG